MPKSKAKKEEAKVKAMQKLRMKKKEQEEEEKRRREEFKKFKEERDRFVSEMEKSIVHNQIAAKLFFQMNYIDGQSILIDFPPFEKPATFYSILTAIYGTAGRCSYPSRGFSSLELKNWSDFMSEDGGLYLYRFTDQFITKPSPSTKRDIEFLQNCTAFSAKGLGHYNDKHKGDEFELVAPLCYNTICRPALVFDIHGNFLARRKGSEVVQLFYYEFSTGTPSYEDSVVLCTILTPVSLSTDIDDPSVLVKVLHPRHIQCYGCQSNLPAGTIISE